MNHGFTDWKKWLDWQVECTAENAFRDMCRNPYTRLYLYYMPGDREYGELSHAPAHQTPMKANAHLWKLASQDPIPCNIPLLSLKAWIMKRARRLPLLA